MTIFIELFSPCAPHHRAGVTELAPGRNQAPCQLRSPLKLLTECRFSHGCASVPKVEAAPAEAAGQ